MNQQNELHTLVSMINFAISHGGLTRQSEFGEFKKQLYRIGQLARVLVKNKKTGQLQQAVPLWPPEEHQENIVAAIEAKLPKGAATPLNEVADILLAQTGLPPIKKTTSGRKPPP